MQHSNFQQKSLQLRKLATLAGFTLLSALVACGGGSGGSNGKRDDSAKPVAPIQAATEFTRTGIDVYADGTIVSGNLAASLDASSNITFKSSPETDLASTYNFAFPSGFPGGVLASGAITTGLFNLSIGSANKDIKILAPLATKQVQNIFWADRDNAGRFGLAVAGYVLQPDTFAWPSSGTATYSGKAFQYIVDKTDGAPGLADDFALFTSNVTATVDYAAKTIVFEMAPETSLLAISANSSARSAQPSRLGDFTINVNEIDFSSNVLGYSFNESQSSQLAWELTANNTLNFFGANAQELAGTVQYAGKTSDSAGVLPSKTITQSISFALAKQ